MALSVRAEILKLLRAAPVVLRSLVRDLDAEQLRLRPGPEEWAIIEVIAHMADTDERALARLRRMLTEDRPLLPGFDQVRLARDRNYIQLPVASELSRYEEGRRRHVEVLVGLEPTAWDRLGRHEEHGDLSIELYELHVSSEDVDHLAQIASLTSFVEKQRRELAASSARPSSPGSPQ